MTDIPTVEEYARAYVDILNGPANGWGQHRCPTTGMDSHHVHRIGRNRYEPKIFDEAVDAVFAALKEENTS